MKWRTCDPAVGLIVLLLGVSAPVIAADPQEPAGTPPPARETAPAAEDDLFEFLGSVDMDDPALVKYLAGQPQPNAPAKKKPDPAPAPEENR